MHPLIKYFTDIFTDDDGAFDIVILMATVAMAWYLLLSGYNVFHLHKDILYSDWGAGAGALVVALGGAYRLKRKPKDEDTKKDA